MSALEPHYVCLKPILVGLADGGVHQFEPGDVIPAEEAHAWGRAVDNLIAVHKVAPVFADRADVDAQLEKLAAVSAAHQAASGGEEGSGEEETPAAPALSPEELDALQAAAEAAAANAGDGEQDEPDEETEDDEDPDPDGSEPAFPRHVGFGKYELSDGSKVDSKEAAVEAQAALDDVRPEPAPADAS